MMSPRLLAALLMLPPASAFAQTQDHAPEALPSSGQMAHDRGESWTYVRPGLSLAAYRNVLLERTVVYAGADAQFGNISMADRRRFAALVDEALRRELAGTRPIVARAGPGTARLRVTLLGAQTTTGGVATATRVTPIGFVVSAARSATGHRGALTGSLLVAIELYDGASGRLEAAAVRRRAPDALDIHATVSTTDTVRAVARDLGRDLARRFRR